MHAKNVTPSKSSGESSLVRAIPRYCNEKNENYDNIIQQLADAGVVYIKTADLTVAGL